MMRFRKLFVFLVIVGTAAGVALPAQTAEAQSGRIDTEFTGANDLSDTDFQTDDGLKYAGVRADNATVNGNSVGEISNSSPKALYIEGEKGGRSTPVTVYSRDVNTNRADIVGLYFRIKPGDDQASPDPGVDGEKLRVDYRDASGTWVNIRTVDAQADGPYTTFTDTLTAADDALHDSFSLRFRIESTTARDPWYIDDMCVLPGGGTCAINNQTPSMSDIGDQSINENESTGTIGFTVSDEEDAASSLTVQASSSNQTLLPDANIALGGSGTNRTVEATPATDESGTATVTVTVSDGTDEISDTFVLSVNGAPNATDDSYSTPEDQVLQVTDPANGVRSNDTDPEGHTMSVQTTPVSGPSNGSVSLNTDGTFTYTPDEDFNGQDQFVYEISDGNGGSDQATVTVTVSARPDVALVDGRTGSSYAPSAGQPGTDQNPIGRLELSTDAGTATVTSLTIRDNGSPSGVSSIELWRSSDNTFDGGDTEVASTSYSGGATFTGLSVDVSSSGVYVFVVLDLASDAGGSADPFLADETDLSLSGGSLGSVNGTETTTFSDAFLSSGSTTLPVELTHLEARSSDQSVVLEWRTAGETNNAGFRIQTQPGPEGSQGAADESVSSDWTTLGTVDGAGTTDEPQSYRYATEELDTGVHRFRLKQVDASGTTTVSRVVTAEIAVDGRFELGTYPNPAHDRATVELAVKESQPVTIAVYNVVGQHMATLHRGAFPDGETRQFRLNTDRWPSGHYFVRVSGTTFFETRRVTVVR